MFKNHMAEQSSRTKNALRNTKYSLIAKIIHLILGFASRTVFIYVLGSSYLGINGLYSEILSVLSFADLGFGTAMTFAMYSPVARKDYQQTVRLLDFYRKVYRVVALIILLLGLAILPFLQYLVKGADMLSVFDLRLYFVLFLLNTVFSYFVTYKYSYINALQQNWLITRINMILNSLTVIVQMITILLFKSFLFYLLTQTVLLLGSRLIIAGYLDKKYPILTEKPETPLNTEERRTILHEVRGLAVHKFSSVAVHQTDNILISSLTELGVLAVGFVSNYNLLINAVLGFVAQIFDSITSGFGNLVASSSRENFRKVFIVANFINFWIYGFCCIAFFILIPPFITLWIGSDKLIDSVSFFLIIINCYLQGQCTVFNNARNAVGDFNKDKWWALVQALVNLIVSVICARKIGLVGIYIGTVASRMIYVIFRPYSTYKIMFNRNCGEYYVQLGKYFSSAMLAGVLTWLITSKILGSVTILRFLLATVTVTIIPNVTFYLLYRRTDAYADVRKRTLNSLKLRKVR